MAETIEQYRTRIAQLKTSIENEPYMKNMRPDIAEGISKTGNRQADIEVRQNTLEDDFVAVQQDASSTSPSGAEVAVARAGFNSLDERLTTKEQEVNAQLAQNKSNIKVVSSNSVNYKGAVLAFIDDDAQSNFKNQWQSILNNKGINISLAVLSEKVGTSGYLTKEELLTLQGQGNDLLAHGASGMDHNNTTPTLFEADVVKGQKWMKENGMLANNYLVYSGGLANRLEIKNVARKYFDYAITAWPTGLDYNKTPVDNWLLARYDGITNSLSSLQSRLDEAIANNGLLIIMTHAHLMDTAQQTKIESYIDYARSKNVPILPFSEAIKVKGNAIALGEHTGTGSFIGVDGRSRLDTSNGLFFDGNPTNKNIDKPITEYKKDHVTVDAIDANGDTFLNGGGTLETYRNLNSDVYSFQLFYPYDTNLIFKRRCSLTDSTWESWSHSGGFISVTTLQRAYLQKVEGMCVFDKTLNKPAWFNGINWVDSNGATV